ncbi:DUF4302 domain-containing protein [Chitinophaga ginsengisoli]|uniref:Uncharacterized protein DUF4302 n=1 Tax=Chitinophaga ginsengisoli TaxID=363837 RepID=A0A2P8G0J9_9BACT|nr:DUF4302 domain-containing protein [Chitinophaga ginsengisoli]PSL27502.1 uncharacterized protein DUF4302 [Chitinophaga ginsengisoli]
MLHNRLYIILLAILFAGCTKDKTTSLLGEKPEERMEKALAEYKATLTGSTYGWKTVVYPSAGGAYSFYFRFGTNDRVTMYSDVSLDAAGTAKESTYRLKAVQRPSLLFDTYSYLHLLSDPDPNVYNGQTGTGYSVDFEYSIDSVSADTIKLTGISFSTKMVLVKATQAEAEAYAAGNYANLISSMEDYMLQNPWLYLQFSDGKKLQVSVNTFTKTFTLIYIDDANQVQLLSSPYYYTLNGIYLQQPIVYGGKSFHEVFWDNARQVFYVTIDGQRIEVKVALTSVVPMHRLLGVDFSSLIVPPQQMAGWSDSFTTIYSNIATSLVNGPYGLTLYYTEFAFDVSQQVMNVDVYVIQNGSLYLARYPFTYTKTASGVFKFTGQAFQGNASLIATDMKPLLDYIRNDHFTMDFIVDTQGGNGKLGQLKSVEHTDFYFTGFPQ